MYDVAIIGCGIVGAAAAFTLSRYQVSVVILEKENDVATGTTKANSAIIHAGYDCEPGTLMARLNVRGNSLVQQLCASLDVPYRQCGSLVVALSEAENAVLERLMHRGETNGVPGLRLIDRAALHEREPQVHEDAIAALYAPTAGIVSPWELALALAETAVRHGAELRLESEVAGISKIDGGYRIRTENGPVTARYILNAAGVYADEIHNMAAVPAFRILPDRGEYYLLDKSEGGRVRHIVFPCPDRNGKGTLVAPTVHGNLIVGPNNEAPGHPGDTATTPEGLAEVAQRARRIVPSVDLGESIRHFAGVRAKTDSRDFIVAEAEGAPGFIDLAGIRSPGLTAAPAIAEMAVGLLTQSGLALTEKVDFCGERKWLRFSALSPEEKAEAVRQDPAYGHVVCRCETVTEGEVLAAMRSPIPPRSVDGVKRRTGAGSGRCQGGFCGPRVTALLARETGLAPTAVPQDLRGSNQLTGETKVSEIGGSKAGEA